MGKHLTGKQLVGKVVNIKSDDSMYDGEWGVVKNCDKDYYFVAISNSKDTCSVFIRKELRVWNMDESTREKLKIN